MNRINPEFFKWSVEIPSGVHLVLICPSSRKMNESVDKTFINSAYMHTMSLSHDFLKKMWLH